MDILNFKYNREEDIYVEDVDSSKFISKAFSWVFIGLATTVSVTTILVMNSRAMYFLLSNPLIFLGIALINFVIGISIRMPSLSLESVKILFIVYSVVNGFILSPLAIYNTSTVVGVLLATTLLFGIMAAYGYFTDSSLLSIGPILSIALTLLIAMNIINAFVGFSNYQLISGYIGAIIFLGFTAYEVNMLKALSSYIGRNRVEGEKIDKYAIYGAFSLYLSFLNLFMNLLKIVNASKKKK